MWTVWLMVIGIAIYAIYLLAQSGHLRGCLTVLGFIAGIVLLCVILTYAKSLGLILAAGILLVIGYFFVKAFRSEAKFQSALAKSGCLSVSDANEITLYKRDPMLGKCLEIQEYTYRTKHYREAEQYYVGATVGGVHTGGIHEHPEEQFEGWTVNSGKYLLTLSTYKITPTYFVLSDELLKEAKEDPFISTLLDNNKLLMIHQVDDACLALKASLVSSKSLYEKTILENCLDMQITNFLLTRSECDRILKWLSKQ